MRRDGVLAVDGQRVLALDPILVEEVDARACPRDAGRGRPSGP